MAKTSPKWPFYKTSNIYDVSTKISRFTKMTGIPPYSITQNKLKITPFDYFLIFTTISSYTYFFIVNINNTKFGESPDGNGTQVNITSVGPRYIILFGLLFLLFINVFFIAMRNHKREILRELNEFDQKLQSIGFHLDYNYQVKLAFVMFISISIICVIGTILTYLCFKNCNSFITCFNMYVPIYLINITYAFVQNYFILSVLCVRLRFVELNKRFR